MGQITINEVTLELDILDADTADRYEAALDTLEQDNNAAKPTGLGAIMRRECEIVNLFFDTLFGGGTANEVFKGKSHVGDHLTALEAVILHATEQHKNFTDSRQKYAPQNRKQKRAL